MSSEIEVCKTTGLLGYTTLSVLVGDRGEELSWSVRVDYHSNTMPLRGGDEVEDKYVSFTDGDEATRAYQEAVKDLIGAAVLRSAAVVGADGVPVRAVILCASESDMILRMEVSQARFSRITGKMLGVRPSSPRLRIAWAAWNEWKCDARKPRGVGGSADGRQ